MENAFTVLPPTLILAPLICFSKKRLFEELAECASSILEVSTQQVIDALNLRESAGSTCIGKGVAIPHALVKSSRSCAVLALLNQSVTFNSIDSDPEEVDIAFSFYFSRSRKSEKDEAMLSHLSELLAEPELVNSLRLSHHDVGKIAAILNKTDQRLAALMKEDAS